MIRIRYILTKIQALGVELGIIDVYNIEVLTIVSLKQLHQAVNAVDIIEYFIVIALVNIIAELDDINLLNTVILKADSDLGIKRFLTMLCLESVITLLNKVTLGTKVTFQLIVIPRANLLIYIIDNVFTDIITGIERGREGLRNTIDLADNGTFDHARSLLRIKGYVRLYNRRNYRATTHTGFKGLTAIFCYNIVGSVMLFKFTISFIVLVSPDEEESFAVLISVNTCFVVYILDGILLAIIEIDVDIGITIE